MRDHAGAARSPPGAPAPLMICGTGMLGRALARACAHRDIRHVATGRSDLDLDDAASIAAALDAHRPWAVIDATGSARVDGAIRSGDGMRRESIPSVHFSSDLVFDGRSAQPYREDDLANPLNAYARKAAMEQAIGLLPGDHLIVRTTAVFAPDDEHNFAASVLRALAEGIPLRVASDRIVSPTYGLDLVDRVLDLTIDGATGVWHLVNDDTLSWAAFAQRIAVAAGLDPALIVSVSGDGPSLPAPRPAGAALASMRGRGLGPLDGAIADFVRRRPAARLRGPRPIVRLPAAC